MIVNECEACGRETKIFIETQRLGDICLACWAEEMGKIIEEHPIVGIEIEHDPDAFLKRLKRIEDERAKSLRS